MNEEKVIEKIKKCLALSKSSNSNEAAAALRQAQRLMEKYNIEMDDVNAAGCNTAHFPINKKPALWQQYLARVCANAFGCDVIFTWGIFWESILQFIAPGIAPELAQYAFDVLLRQAKRDRAQHIKTKLYRCKKQNKTIRADVFCEAWVQTVENQVARFAERPENVQQSIDAYLQKKHPNLQKGKTKSRVGKKAHDSDALAGHAAGKNANLNRGMNGQQQQHLEAK